MNEDSDLELQKIWSGNSEEADMSQNISIIDKNNKFSISIKWRNYREYIAAAIVFLVFGYYLISVDNIFYKLGSFFTLIATGYIVYQIKFRSSSSLVSDNVEPVITFYRRKLERERDLLRSVWRWYILPFVPGFCLQMYGHRQMKPDADLSTYILIVILLVAFMIALNYWGARRIQAQIDELP